MIFLNLIALIKLLGGDLRSDVVKLTHSHAKLVGGGQIGDGQDRGVLN